jgi:3'-phosphoadenosine 5'-phosphosulfate sulfotransferase (PAPS reductase)/FAD synthetase
LTELYPLIIGGRVVGVIGSGGDATKVCYDDNCKYYLWMSSEVAYEVTSLLDKSARIEVKESNVEGFIPLGSWLLSPPYVHARAVPDVDEYARMLAKTVGRDLQGRRVLLGFSGGKDSMAALLVLLKLLEYVDFKLHVMYVHIPFLESPRSVEFVERVASKLGIDIDIRTAPRREMKSLLKWKGLPRRGYRYCTVYKAKPMRQLRKEDPRLIEVIGDRLTESPKRMERLSKAAAYRVVLVGRKFRPTFFFTLLDVVDIVKKSGLIHPDYLDGLPRVACTICPYKSLHEFHKLPPLEDEELIEKVMEKTWKKWYSWTSFELFKQHHLWRYPTRLAKAILNAKLAIKPYTSTFEELDADWVEEAYKRIWVEPTPKAPELEDPWKAAELAIRAWRKKRQFIIPSL